MIIHVTMKTPDALENAISDEINPTDKNFKDAMNICKKWFEYNEIVTLEIDTKLKTCIIVER